MKTFYEVDVIAFDNNTTYPMNMHYTTVLVSTRLFVVILAFVSVSGLGIVCNKCDYIINVCRLKGLKYWRSLEIVYCFLRGQIRMVRNIHSGPLLRICERGGRPCGTLLWRE